MFKYFSWWLCRRLNWWLCRRLYFVTMAGCPPKRFRSSHHEQPHVLSREKKNVKSQNGGTPYIVLVTYIVIRETVYNKVKLKVPQKFPMAHQQASSRQ